MEPDARPDMMPDPHAHRPIERCVLRMSAAGIDDEEIGARLRRSASYPARVRAMSTLHEPSLAGMDRAGMDRAGTDLAVGGLRPLERVVLHRLSEGVTHSDLARRLHRQEGFVEFIEAMASYKLEH
jgi:DNA-binding CsgD family transcriptional regulator